MAYTAQLSTLRSEGYLLTIDGNGVGTGELTLSGDNPVTIEYDQDDIFKPLKMSACSVTVLASAPLLDLYTGTLNGVTLRVERGTIDDDGVFSNGVLIWFGFLTPNVYSSGYKDVLDELTLEFVDPLSAMENVKFERFKSTSSSDTFFATFTEYINRALSEVGALSVITNVSGMPDDLAYVGCMQRNYIDETDDEDDGAMTWQEVLESILRYMNKTAYIYGNTFYIYDAADKDRIEEPKSLATIGIAEGNGSISLGEVYNKVTVVENTNPIDDLLNEAIDDEDNIESYMYEGDENYDATSSWGAALGFYRVPYTLDGINYIDCRAIFKPKNEWSFVWSGLPGYTILGVASTGHGYGTGKSVIGALPFLWVNKSGTAKTSYINSGGFIYWETHYEADDVPASLDWNKSVFLFGGLDGITVKPGKTGDPYIKYQSASQSTVLKDGYILLKLKYAYQAAIAPNCETTNYTWSKVSGFSSNYKNDKWKFKLRIGDKYWNGSEWTTTESTFEAQHTWVGDDNIFNNEVSLDNTASYEMSLQNNDEAHVIPVEGDLFGDVAFDIYPPTDFQQEFGGDDITGKITTQALQITELSLQYTTSSANRGLLSDDADADITICNIIDDNNVNDSDDVEFTTNTYNKLQTSYSYAIKKADTSYAYYIPDTIPEQTCISRLVNYYSQAKMQYQNTINDKKGAHLTPVDNITITAFGTKTFTIGSVTFNLAEDSADVTLLEL